MEVKGVAVKNVNLSFSAGALKNGSRLTPASWLSFGERVAINRVSFPAVSTDRVGHIKSRRHSTVAGADKGLERVLWYKSEQYHLLREGGIRPLNLVMKKLDVRGIFTERQKSSPEN